MRLFRRFIWLAIGVIALVIGVRSWLAPADVRSHTVGPGVVIKEVMGTGTLEAHISANVSPKISGLIREVLVDQGDRVAAGDLLVRLDDSDLRRQVEVAEGTLGAARAGVERQLAEKKRAAAVLDQASYDFSRIEGLVQQNTAASTEYQEAMKVLRVAEAEVARADAALLEARKQEIAAEKSLDFQQAKLADTLIQAPFAGLIVRRDRDPGDVVVPGSSMQVLVATDELWISAWVDETEMNRLAAGQAARVVFRADPAHPVPGRVARLGAEVDRETREFLVDVRVENLPTNWAIGQRAEIYIEADRAEAAAVIPLPFLVWQSGKAGVFAEVENRASWRPIRLGLQGRQAIEVIEGVRADEHIIMPAGARGPLRDGQRVRRVMAEVSQAGGSS